MIDGQAQISQFTTINSFYRASKNIVTTSLYFNKNQYIPVPSHNIYVAMSRFPVTMQNNISLLS